MRVDTTYCLFAVTLATVIAAGCATAPTPKPEPREDLSVPGATLFVAQLRPEPATPEALSVRASGIAAVTAGGEAPIVAPEDVLRAFSATPNRADLLVESAGHMSVHIDTVHSDLLVVNGVVADDAISSTDIGPARARSVFEETVKLLVSRQLVDPNGLAIDRARTGRVMQAENRRGGETNTRVKEYLFEVPRVVSQVEVFGANVTVAVHRSGRIASIRTVGPAASRTNASFKRTLSASSLTERARQENPGSEVVPLGLRYAWSAVRSDATVELPPREAFRVVPVTVVEDRTMHGRAHFVFYAVDDEKAPPIVWPRPNPEATGDARK